MHAHILKCLLHPIQSGTALYRLTAPYLRYVEILKFGTHGTKTNKLQTLHSIYPKHRLSTCIGSYIVYNTVKLA